MSAGNEWEDLYHIAVLETNVSKMEERIEVAESAMHAPLHQLSLHHGGTLEEHRAIAGALNRIDILRSEVATWRESTPQELTNKS
jgi:hypothetical protein